MHDYDLVLINSSGGKDSQAMLTHLVELADAQGFPRARLVVVHADLGRAEWPGTRELAEEQAQTYGLRFETVRRAQGDLVQQIEDRGMFPSSTTRYCTSDQKTGQVSRLLTSLVRERNLPSQTRILNCLGMRAQESHERAKKPAFSFDKRASNGRRHVDRWLPIHAWTTDEVWATIRRSGLRWHEAYDAGMSRLSCVFCVLASERDLCIAAKLNPALAQTYAELEERIDHRFRNDLSMREIIEKAAA
jgi:3'-phosphoadenosine 5'-phosphosulfate sulfotransferase (PAPS reductase)/FAD synthetase